MHLILFSLGVILLVSGGAFRYFIEKSFMSTIGKPVDYVSFQQKIRESSFRSKHKAANAIISIGLLTSIFGAYNL